MGTYRQVVDSSAAHVRASYNRQVLDPSREDDGAFILAKYGMPAASHDANADHLAAAAYAYLLDGSPLRADAELLERILRSIAFQRRWQRDTGLIDLPPSNPSSPPDTAFTIQVLAPPAELAMRLAEAGDAGAQEIADGLLAYIRRAAEGVVGRGFHTANHRWVICSALAMAVSLIPDFDPSEYVNSILAEGIDINDDGEFTERSSAIYNAVCDRSLRAMADRLNMPELLDHVRHNLDLTLHLLHADNSVVTSVSNRQDKGTRMVPYSLADSFLDMAVRDGNPEFATAADILIDGALATPHFLNHVLAVYALNEAARTMDVPRAPLPSNYSIQYPASRMWRVRRDKMSTTTAAGLRIPFALRYGGAELVGVRIFGSYIIGARFQADDFTMLSENAVRLVHHTELHQNVGYDLPLGRGVTSEEFDTLKENRGPRERWTLPPFDITLDVEEVQGGFNLHLHTDGGLDRIAFQMECCFAGPGQWETGDMAMLAQDGQSVILKQGHGVWRAGDDAISIGPGSDAHRMFQMHNSEPMSDTFRVVIPFTAPVDHRLEVRYGEWSDAERRLVPRALHGRA